MTMINTQEVVQEVNFRNMCYMCTGLVKKADVQILRGEALPEDANSPEFQGSPGKTQPTYMSLHEVMVAILCQILNSKNLKKYLNIQTRKDTYNSYECFFVALVKESSYK